MKTVDFPETIAASDIKVGSSRHLIEFLKEYLVIYRGYSNFLLNMAFISPSEVKNIYIS